MNHHTREPVRHGVPSSPDRERRRRRWGVAVLAVLAAATSLALLAAGCGQTAAQAPAGSGGGGDGGVAQGSASSLVWPGTSGLVSPAAQAPGGHGGSGPGPGGGPGPSGIGGGTALFGGNLALEHQTGRLGRPLAIVRIYDHIGESFPVAPDQELMAAGSTLLVSLDSTGTSYASIAAGRDDGTISTFLRSVNQAAFQYHLRAIYVSFEHEPDNPLHASLGTPAQFVQAWDHVHQLAVDAHLDWNEGGRLHWVWILIHGAFGSPRAAEFWPGSSETDIVAVDGYNSSGCRQDGGGPVTPASLFGPVLSFAATHGGLPVFVSEWASDPIPAGVQANFIREMQDYVDANHTIAAALYWDSDGDHCNYSVDGNPTSIAALATMGESSVMQGTMGG